MLTEMAVKSCRHRGLQCIHSDMSSRLWLCVCVLLACLVQPCLVLTPNTPISQPEFATTPSFSPQDVQRYYGVFDEETPIPYFRQIHLSDNRQSLFVAAMEYVYRLNVGDIDSSDLHMRSTRLKADRNTEAMCNHTRTNPVFMCKNHIRTIVEHPERNELYACGTGAFKPTDYHLSLDTLVLNHSGGPYSGRAKCPPDPTYTHTCDYVVSGNPGGAAALYTGTVDEKGSAKDPVIYRPPMDTEEGSISRLRTPSNRPSWLNDAEFVKTLDIGEHVYFFFREVEEDCNGMKPVSRIARVCKNDKGSSSQSYWDRWTSYFKADLSCFIHGDDPFHFNELRDVLWVPSSQNSNDGTFYAVFSRNQYDLDGSAVCTFPISTVEGTFLGSFADAVDSQVPNPHPGTCQEDSQQLSELSINFIMSHQMMASAVDRSEPGPLLVKANAIFTLMAIDTVVTDNMYTVMFLATSTGEIHKIVSWTSGDGPQTNALTTWTPFSEETTIWSMIIEDNHLYLTTDSSVVQIPIEQCDQYTTCTDCARDPYCGWDPAMGSCVTYRSGLAQAVQGSALQECYRTGSCFTSSYKTVRAAGDAVHLSCETMCKSDEPVQWRHNGSPIDTNSGNHVITRDDGLVILSATHSDAGEYGCLYENTWMKRYNVTLPGCEDAECIWREEFRNWCNEFDHYKNEFNDWKCAKDHCTSCETCGDVSGQCFGP